MDELIARKGSKKFSSAAPSIIGILQEHSERLLKLEALVAIAVGRNALTDEQPPAPEQPPPTVEEPPKPPRPEQPPQQPLPPLPVVIDEVALAVVQEALNARTEEAKNINNDILALDDLEYELSADDTVSVCTDDCRDLVKEFKASATPMGTWKVMDEQCGACSKQQIKAYAAAKKVADKMRAKDQKAIKETQKRLVKEEMRELQSRLKNIKKGRDPTYGMDDTSKRQDELREELKKAVSGKSTAEFKIQMYV
jgi:hypothetical protein